MAEEHCIGVDLGGTKILAGVFDSDHNCLFTDKNKTKAELGYESHRADRRDHPWRGAPDRHRRGEQQGGGHRCAGHDQCRRLDRFVCMKPRLARCTAQGRPRGQAWVPGLAGQRLQRRCDGYSPGEFESKPRDMVSIFLGTGIGAGIITNGAFLSGATQAAGEVGHMVLDPDGPVCGCGTRGCYRCWPAARLFSTR